MTTTKEQIQGWKEIAAYLGRDERTAKRWEKQRGLPVRRIPGGGRANVYVLIPELEAWLAQGRMGAALDDAEDEASPAGANGPTHSEQGTQQAISDAESPAERGAAPGFSFQSAYEATPAQPSPAVRPAAAHAAERRGLWAWGVAAAAAVGGVLLWLHTSAPVKTSAAVSTPLPVRAVYRSPIRGVDEMYLQGVYFFEERTAASLENADRIFSDVISRDPNDAPAYTGLAETYLMQREYAMRDSAEAYRLAHDAASKALSLNARLPEAHAVLGFVDFFANFDARDATEQFKDAIRLDPGCVIAHHWYGSMLTHQGRYAQALEELRQAQRLEPSSNAVISSMAYALGLDGHRNEALAMLDRVMAVDPDAPSPHRISAHLSMVTPRDVPRYLAQSKRFATIRHDPQELQLLDLMQAAYERGGEPAMWRAVIGAADRLPGQFTTEELTSAEVQTGNDERAMQIILELAAKRDTRLLNLKINPLLANLHSDPRFQQLLVQLDLSPAQSLAGS